MTLDLPHRCTVELGTPITSEQAAQGVLRMVRSGLVGDVDRFSRPVLLVDWIDKNCYPALSKGERYLVDVARAICRPNDEKGARISALGGLDLTNRRKVLMVLAYLHLGHIPWDVLEADVIEFGETFGEAL